MKKTAYLSVIPIALGLYLFFSAYSGDECDYPSGAPAGYTGSPGDGKTCTECHGGTAAPVTDWITSDIPASGYTPGNTYNVTVTVTGSGSKGFEVSPQDPSGTQLGTLVAGTGSHLTGGTKYVTQNSGQNSNPATWTFQWIAPAAGTGDVTFYGAFAVSKNTTKTSTLSVQESVAAPLTVMATATPSTITEGDSSHLDCTPAGGGGTYTYSWTSIPAGFVSNLKDPWVSPLVTTDYMVTVSDGTSTASDVVTVTVTTGVGIAGHNKGLNGRIFPNPTQGAFTLTVPGPLPGNTEVTLTDLAGSAIWQEYYAAGTDPVRVQTDLTQQPDGIYLVVIRSGSAAQTLKVIKTGR